MLTKFVVPDPLPAELGPHGAPRRLAGAERAARRLRDHELAQRVTHLVGMALRRGFDHAWIVDLRDGWTFERFLPDFPTRAQRSLNAALERSVVGGPTR